MHFLLSTSYTSALPELIAQQLVPASNKSCIKARNFRDVSRLFMFTLICPLAMLGSSLKELWVPPNQQT